MCNCKQEYKELKDKYDKIACQIIVDKLKKSNFNYKTNSVTIGFNIVIYPQGMTYDGLIKTCVVPNLRKELKKLNIFEE